MLEINELNRIEFEMGDVPFLGGWCKDADDFVFTQFFPNFLKGLPYLDETAIEWAKKRARFIVEMVGSRSDG